MSPKQNRRLLALKFTPLEFETPKSGQALSAAVLLKFTPLEFETFLNDIDIRLYYG